MIDFILEQTNQTQLIYTGYSQGGTSMFVLLSERPEYNEKIASIHLMGPAVFYTKTNPIVTPLLKNINTFKVGVNFYNSKSFQTEFRDILTIFGFIIIFRLPTSVYMSKLNCMK